MEREARRQLAAEADRWQSKQAERARVRAEHFAACRPLLVELVQYFRSQDEDAVPVFREVKEDTGWADTDDYLGLGWYVYVSWGDWEDSHAAQFVLMVDADVKGAGLFPNRTMDRRDPRRLRVAKGQPVLRATDEPPDIYPGGLREGIVDLMKKRATSQ